MTTIDEKLIGKKFTRISEEGTTSFTGTITRLLVTFSCFTEPFSHNIPVIHVVSENNVIYELTEIVLIGI